MDFAQFLEINYGCIITLTALLLFLIPNKKLEEGVRTLFLILIGIAIIDAASYTIETYYATLSYPTTGRLLASLCTYTTKVGLIYTMILLFLRHNNGNRLKIWLAVPFAICVLLESTVLFCPLVYYYNESNEFIRGPYYMLPNYFVIAYTLVPVFMAFRGIKREKTELLTLGIMSGFILFNILYEIAESGQGTVIRETTTAVGILAYYMFFRSQAHMDELEKAEEERIISQEKTLQNILTKTIATLSYAVDAKDSYTNGHSARVADYARTLAKLAGKTERECDDIYYAGLLHDIGKIAVPEEIINKPDKLTKDEYEIIKLHPVEGGKILAEIDDIPELASGALYHHERYDGKGYPEGLAGEDIPEIARIIAVADAYDAMTSKRSYRGILSQADVREQIVNGLGTQFDPYYGKYMVQLIDKDINYTMREF